MELHSTARAPSNIRTETNPPAAKAASPQDEPTPPLPSESYTALDLSQEWNYSGPFIPKADQAYVVNYQEIPVAVSFDARAIAFFEHIDYKVDLENAQLVGPNGATHPLDSRAAAQPSLTEYHGLLSGEKSSSTTEPWTFRVPGMPGGVFGKPQGVQFLGGDSGGYAVQFLDHNGQPLPKITSGTVRDDFQEFRTDTKVLRRDRYATALELLASDSALTAAIPGEFLTDETLAGLRFKAPNQEALEKIKAGFESVLGESSRSRAETVNLDNLKAFESTFQSMLQAEQAKNEVVDGFAILRGAASQPEAARQLQEIAGPGSDHLEGAELLEAVRGKLQRSCPLEIIVIPRGRTAADCIDNVDDATREQLKKVGRAYFHSLDPIAYRMQTGANDLPPQRLFIGEEVLDSEQAIKVVYKHEMLHVFEHRYANPEELKELKASFDEATEFQSLYGSSFSEYLPTVGEEFLAAYDSEGPQWVKEQHPRVYQMLSQLMNMDPAA